jgi:ABC-2 type transport system ATP-binding protein
VYFGQLKGMSKNDARARIREWAGILSIEEYLRKKAKQLSKGNQQKVQFVASLLHRPQLLLLDEPFSGLDPVNVEVLKNAVRALSREGTTMIFSSHRMEHVEELCQGVTMMKRGQAVVQGDVRELKRTFGGNTIEITCDGDLEWLGQHPLVLSHHPNAQGARVVLRDRGRAQELLIELVERVSVRKFEIKDASLHEIFLAKVGDGHV